MKRYIQTIILINILLALQVLSSEVRIFDHDTNKMIIRDLKTFYFTLDEKYSKNLSECKSEHFDPSMFALGRAPLLLIIDKDDKDEETYQLFYYLQSGNDAYFMKCEYKIIDGIIFGIRVKDPFMAKKMPKLVFGGQNR